jgi:hypothetical protein
MLSPKEQKIMIAIPYFGALPKWFEIWLFTARRNDKIDFHLFQEALADSQDGNVFYHRMTMADFNKLPLLMAERCTLNNPYKICDYRPLLAELFPDIVSRYAYWGFGDLDVVYGDILSVLSSSFGKFDYISTGWEGESGPLAFLRNSEQVNRLWRSIPDIHRKLNRDMYVGVDELDFVSQLKSNNFSCDIAFRECLLDLPARWKNGKLTSLRTNKEYVLHHFGGGLRRGKSEMVRKSAVILDHLKQGGAIRIKKQLSLSRKRLVAPKYTVSRIYGLDHIHALWKRAIKKNRFKQA